MNLPAWYVLHTKPKQEKRASLNLEGWGIEAFTPWLPSRSRAAIPLPLFPGYIFARFQLEKLLHKITFTRGISHIVSFGGVPAEVEEDVIAAIRSRTDQFGAVRVAPRLQPGDLVTAESGPLRDLVGVFRKELPDTERVEILLTTIAYSARINVSKYDVRKLEGVAPGVKPSQFLLDA
jgi:transcriptional antiterminator RfaH